MHKTNIKLDKNFDKATDGNPNKLDEVEYDSQMPVINDTEHGQYLPWCTGYTFLGYYDDKTEGIQYYDADGNKKVEK